MNNSSAFVELKATGVRFFSQGDEAAFFAWLAKLDCVERYEGRGLSLFISVNTETLDEDGLRELLSLFRRYEVGLKQLAVFDWKEFADWFRNKQAYWYDEIFG